jgi:4,5-DOPA dioxygenase extradiol
MSRMPAVFIGHGSPMNAIEHNRFTTSWAEFGSSIERPRAVLAVSAHWYVGFTAVTAMERPKTIHDFFGFPQQLFDIEYPAPGDPALAREVAQVLDPIWVGEDLDSWGIDHGTWSVLVHVFPDADVPVVQLAIDMNKSLSEHLAIGAKLNTLRDQGVLVLGSGNVVHNLRDMDWSHPESAFDWNDRFDRDVRRIMTNDPQSLVEVGSHQDFRLAVPTPDHFLPLAYIAGIAAESGVQAEVLVGGPQYGSLSMTSYIVR